MKKSHYILSLLGLATFALVACKKNFQCTCTTEQTVYTPNTPNGFSSNHSNTSTFRALEEKKAEQDCFSTFATETFTRTSPTETSVITTTCAMQ